jgi:hypothetical protein
VNTIKRTTTTAEKTKDPTKPSAKKAKLTDSKITDDADSDSVSDENDFDVMPGFSKCGPTFQIFLVELARVNKLAAQGKPHGTDMVEALILKMADESKATKAAAVSKEDN